MSDSAGAVIVQHRGDVWNVDAPWSIGRSPDLTVGVENGPLAYVFDGIVGAAILSDRRIVVADRSSSSLRWYDSTGEFLFQVGRSGEGPGEFSRLSFLSRANGDTLIATDGLASRATLLTSDGNIAGTTMLLGLSGFPSRAYRLSNGRYVAANTGFSSSQLLNRETAPGFRRFPVPIVSTTSDAASVDTIAIALGMEMYFRVRGASPVFGPHAFGKGLSFAASDQFVYFGTAEEFDIKVLSANGDTVRRIRAPDVDLRLTDREVTAVRARARERLAPDLPQERRVVLEQDIEAMPYPGDRPAFASFIISGDGNLWIGEHVNPVSTRRRWTVFTPEGRHLGTVQFPVEFHLLAVAEGIAAGRWEGALGVESVALFYLVDAEP